MMQVHIRRNSDGLVRVYDYDGRWESYSEYMWLDGGNYSCDCNRYRFFKCAANEEPLLEHYPCGETAYTVIKFVLPDGAEISGDDE